MTTDELRDWHAKRLGWTKNENLGPPCGWLEPDRWTRGDPGNDGTILPLNIHPIPATLDAAASLMPEGWVWMRVSGTDCGKRCLLWTATNDSTGFEITPDTGDEIHDRLLLAKLAHEHMKEADKCNTPQS